MKNYILLFILGAFAVACSRDVLDMEPISEISRDRFYNNTEEVELATIAIYDGLQAVPMREFALTEMRSDNTKSKSSEGDWGQFESFGVRATNVAIGTYWSANYNVVFRCNRVLENLGAVTDNLLSDQFEGEAKFNRALAHFNMVRAYGDVPLIDQEVGIDDTEFFGRDPEADVYDFIIQDLEEAMTLLPAKSAMEYGRATSGAAEALLAKVYLTIGNYSAAQSACEAVLTTGDYSLEPEYRDVFYSEGNDEVLFAIPYIGDNDLESQDFSFEMTAGGVRAGLNYMTDDFMSKMDPLDTERNEVLRNPVVADECGKFLTESLNARLCGNDWIVLRLADVYLMHVESIMNGFEATQNIDAINSFNAVRGRVGLDSIASDGSGEITLDMLLKERRYELAFENQRLYDLVRTGRALSTLSDFAEAEGHSFSSTDLVLPIPQGQINVSDGQLKQNPGY